MKERRKVQDSYREGHISHEDARRAARAAKEKREMSEREAVTLWVTDAWGEAARITRAADGKLDAVWFDDEIPETLCENMDRSAALVFNGVIRKPTEEEDPEGQYHDWWDGQFRPATAAEILAVFSPEPTPRPAELNGTEVET